jgi:hypothetical protein
MHNKEHFSCRGVQLIQRLLLFALTGGILLLLVEIRFEHSAVMGEKWQSWIPCIYLPKKLGFSCLFSCVYVPD